MAMRVGRCRRDILTSKRLRNGVSLAALGAAFLLASCEADHTALEKKPTGGHVGGAAGAGGASAGSGLTSNGGAAAIGGGHSDDEPPGTDRLTIVNGVVDAPTVVLCLAKVASDGSVTPFGDPIATLDYAQSVVLPDLAHVDLAEDTLQPLLIAGDLTLVDGLDCASAVELARTTESPSPPAVDDSAGGAAGAAGARADVAAAGSAPSEQGGAAGAAGATNATDTSEGGAAGEAATAGEGGSAGESGTPPPVRSPLRVRGLPAIPAGTLNQGRSLALVADGCMGGATYGGMYAEDYCGAGFSENAPTLSAVLVNLSRVVSLNHVGMQVIHASLATGAIDVDTSPPPPQPGSGVTIVSNVSLGQVAPRPASLAYTADDLKSATNYDVSVSSQGRVLFSERWSAVLGNGGLTELDEEHTYALVFSGPRGDLPAVAKRWNAAALTVIPVDAK